MILPYAKSSSHAWVLPSSFITEFTIKREVPIRMRVMEKHARADKIYIMPFIHKFRSSSSVHDWKLCTPYPITSILLWMLWIESISIWMLLQAYNNKWLMYMTIIFQEMQLLSLDSLKSLLCFEHLDSQSNITFNESWLILYTKVRVAYMIRRTILIHYKVYHYLCYYISTTLFD